MTDDRRTKAGMRLFEPLRQQDMVLDLNGKQWELFIHLYSNWLHMCFDIGNILITTIYLCKI